MSREIKVCNVNTLNDVNDRVRALQRSVKTDLQNIRQEAAQQAIYESNRRIRYAKEEMQRNLENGLQGINSRMQRIDAEHRQRMQQLTNRIYDDMADMNSSLKREINDKANRLQRNMDALSKNISRRFDEQQSHIDDIRSDINNILREIADNRQRVAESIQIAQALYQKVCSNPKFIRFIPIDNKDRIDTTMQTLDGSNAAILINEIMIAERAALRAQLQYEAIQNSAINECTQIQKIVNDNKVIKVPGTDITLEVNFWTRGEYEKVRERLENIREELEGAPTIERIENIVTELDEIEKNFEKSINVSIERATLSENRVMITEDIITSLIEQGYRVDTVDGKEEVGYLGGETENDWREGVYAILSKGDKENITIIIRPDEKNENNQIIFHRNDNRPITDKGYMDSLRTIKNEIEKSGHKLGDITAPADGGNEQIPELRSGSDMAKKGASEKINKRIRTR